MSGRIFQNVVLQLKENTDRTVGVIDGEGIVIACSELAMIGQRWACHQCCWRRHRHVGGKDIQGPERLGNPV